MTTIATDGRSLASDSQFTMGSDVVGFGPKAFKLDDGRIVGCCGSVAHIQKFVRWINAPGDEKPSLDEFSALILNRDGTVDYMDKDLEPIRFQLPNAIGSGEGIAVGAMLAGKTPAEAVTLASTRDTNTGGDVVEFSIDEPPTLRAVA